MESSDNAESPANSRRDTKDSDAESSDDELLFNYPSRGAFKRKARESDESDEDDSDDGGGKGGGKGSDSDDSDDDDDDDDNDFNSSPELRRMRARPLGRANPPITPSADFLDMLSSDDENLPPPSPKPRCVPDQAAIEAEADARVNEYMDKEISDASAGPQGVLTAADREYQRKTQRRMAAASVIGLPGRTGSGLAERQAAMSEAAAAAEAASSKAAAERSRCELSRRLVRLRVERSKTQGHFFKTKLSTEVGEVATHCRRQRALLSRDEEDAELSLYYEETLLDGDKSLMDCGIKGDAMLRLEVTGEAACFSGPPISLKVRTDGGKTFTVEITMDTTFSAFMEGFNAAVGVPPERSGESVFKFDGDNLRPNGTPEAEDMDSGELIDAKLPADLMHGVQASPSEIKLAMRPKKKNAAGKKAPGATSSAHSTTAAAAAASAVPLGRTRVTRSKRGNTRSRGGGSSSSAVGGQQPEIVVLD